MNLNSLFLLCLTVKINYFFRHASPRRLTIFFRHVTGRLTMFFACLRDRTFTPKQPFWVSGHPRTTKAYIRVCRDLYDSILPLTYVARVKYERMTSYICKNYLNISPFTLVGRVAQHVFKNWVGGALHTYLLRSGKGGFSILVAHSPSPNTHRGGHKALVSSTKYRNRVHAR